MHHLADAQRPERAFAAANERADLGDDLVLLAVLDLHALVARRVERDELLRRRRDDLDGRVARVHQVARRELEHVRGAADVHRLGEHEAAELRSRRPAGARRRASCTACRRRCRTRSTRSSCSGSARRRGRALATARSRTSRRGPSRAPTASAAPRPSARAGCPRSPARGAAPAESAGRLGDGSCRAGEQAAQRGDGDDSREADVTAWRSP